jgi:hypothetical protein
MTLQNNSAKHFSVERSRVRNKFVPQTVKHASQKFYFIFAVSHNEKKLYREAEAFKHKSELRPFASVQHNPIYFCWKSTNGFALISTFSHHNAAEF